MGRCVVIVGALTAALALAGPAGAQDAAPAAAQDAAPAAARDAAPAAAPDQPRRRAGPGAAPAPAPPLMMFHGPAPAPGIASDARAALADLARSKGTALVDVSPAPPPAPEAAARLRRAIAAYDSFEHERALVEVQAALDEAARTGAAGLTPDELGDAYIYAGLVLTIARSDPTPAWRCFVQAATLDPARRLDPVRFPPRVVETFQRALEAVAASPPATLRVDVDAACEVAIDARPVPAGQAIQVARGHHHVRVRCAGHADHGERVLVATDTVTVRPALVAQAPPAPEALRALARQRGAASVLAAVAVVPPDAAPTVTLTLLDVDTGRERGRVFVSLDGDRARRRAALRRAVESLADRLDGADELPDDNGPMTPHPAVSARPIAAPRPTPWYRRPWVWGVTGAALGAAVLLPFVLDRDGSSGFDVRLGGELPP